MMPETPSREPSATLRGGASNTLEYRRGSSTRNPTTMKRPLVVTLLTVTSITACNRDRTVNADSSATSASVGQSTAAAPAAAAAAAVTIVSPAEGATTGRDVTVTLRSEGVRIAKADGARVEGVGHYHLFLDTVPTTDSVVIPPNTSKIVHIGTGDSTYTFKGVPAGPHRIIAVIGYGNHVPMAGRRDTVDFTVKP